MKPSETQLEFPFNASCIEKTKVVNVSSVPQRSVFRYAGGKTWLVPTIRKWLNGKNDIRIVEPFLGGGSVSLAAVAENYCEHALMIEKDEDVASVWETIFQDAEWLVKQIIEYDLSIDNVNATLASVPTSIKERALQTIIRNRTCHGGILAKGGGMLKNGENGKGIKSRWYPETLAKRIMAIASYKDRMTFICGDAFDYMNLDYYDDNTYFFVDPPYTIAGKRLYTLCDVDHEEIFKRVHAMTCHFLLTYDKSDYVLELISKYDLKYREMPMQTTHLVKKYELLISDNFDWFD